MIFFSFHFYLLELCFFSLNISSRSSFFPLNHSEIQCLNENINHRMKFSFKNVNHFDRSETMASNYFVKTQAIKPNYYVPSIHPTLESETQFQHDYHKPMVHPDHKVAPYVHTEKLPQNVVSLLEPKFHGPDPSIHNHALEIHGPSSHPILPVSHIRSPGEIDHVLLNTQLLTHHDPNPHQHIQHSYVHQSIYKPVPVEIPHSSPPIQIATHLPHKNVTEIHSIIPSTQIPCQTTASHSHPLVSTLLVNQAQHQPISSSSLPQLSSRPSPSSFPPNQLFQKQQVQSRPGTTQNKPTDVPAQQTFRPSPSLSQSQSLSASSSQKTLVYLAPVQTQEYLSKFKKGKRSMNKKPLSPSSSSSMSRSSPSNSSLLPPPSLLDGLPSSFLPLNSGSQARNSQTFRSRK